MRLFMPIIKNLLVSTTDVLVLLYGPMPMPNARWVAACPPKLYPFGPTAAPSISDIDHEPKVHTAVPLTCSCRVVTITSCPISKCLFVRVVSSKGNYDKKSCSRILGSSA